MTYYHRFYIESLYSENRRWILRWLFRTFPVYLFETTPAGYKGRFYTRNVRSPKAAFRDLTFRFRGDRSLCLWVISYDLQTIYLERNIYISMGNGEHNYPFKRMSRTDKNGILITLHKQNAAH